ncbi:Gfo/Idh/MocA family oxidoreductase [Halorubrum sp. AD140]|uniref:Gfo/Idh/MocA family protein n=1 Tax=Halorubrum sp. AD140 TaxID=3050073 RepID=UPI002ACD0DD3|nr:Gfo/Idh/MocA family oxidoreductase [Halorubrum sp. AD140]MDZ5810247.1 Gfo/Idh/MocA family oxidoreductase [Halorubrum sp. AD140]
MKYGVIGTGYWGSNHARVASELAAEGAIDDVVLCDVDERRLAELCESYGVEGVTDYERLPEIGVDAATISTPSPTHHEIATTLLERGVDVIVEKPLALDGDDAWSIVETAREHDRTLAVGHIFRHHPALVDLRDRIDRGELGRLKYLTTSRFSFRAPRETTGALYSLGVHDVDVSNYLLGRDPERIYCSLDDAVREGIDETATLVMEYDGATSVINESWQVPVFGKRRDLVVVGTEKAAYVDYLDDNVVELYDSRVTERGGELRVRDEGKQVHTAPNDEPLRAEIEDFVAASRGDGTLRAPGRVGARAVELLEHATRSAEEHTVVSVGERGARTDAMTPRNR